MVLALDLAGSLVSTRGKGGGICFAVSSKGAGISVKTVSSPRRDRAFHLVFATRLCMKLRQGRATFSIASGTKWEWMGGHG